MYGLFYNKTNIYYNMSKIIKLTESDVINLIKKVIKEQNKDPFVYDKRQLTADADSTRVNIQAYDPKSGRVQTIPSSSERKVYTKPMPNLDLSVYSCAPSKEYQLAVYEAIKVKRIDPIFVKYGLGILGRESDYGKIVGNSWGSIGKYLPSKYAIKTPFEIAYNALPDTSKVKILIKWGLSKYKEITTGSSLSASWVPSMGINQMTPDVAKKYGVSMWQLLGSTGALIATSEYLKSLYNELTNYDSNQPSIINENGKDIVNPNSTGNARLDAAITSYNLGSKKFKKNFCQSNDSEKKSKGLKTTCESPDAVPNSLIKNYLPKYDTKTSEGTITSHGYLKEVVNNGKKFNCF
jgi:hypothetical protein